MVDYFQRRLSTTFTIEIHIFPYRVLTAISLHKKLICKFLRGIFIENYLHLSPRFSTVFIHVFYGLLTSYLQVIDRLRDKKPRAAGSLRHGVITGRNRSGGDCWNMGESPAPFIY